MPNNTEEELAKALAELEAVKAQYQEFVYVVSHDLIAPLRQVEGFANILYDKYADQFDDKAKRHFGLVVGGAEKGKAILEALLRYSRVGTAEKNPEAIDCSEMLNDVLEELRPMIESSGANIQCDCAAKIIANKEQIHLLFNHLIHNALLYQEAGNTPQLKVSATELDEHWQFTVEDNGIGIAESHFEKIFTILRRAVKDKDYEGIGMGLALVKNIVQRHGGKIWVKSEPGAGSSFCFTLAKESLV